ncbi:MAG: DASS family sodium-coupled anion symporter [bacterium]|nr:MAG: DASS family sodium-coupled anion symporter [bacterium]
MYPLLLTKRNIRTLLVLAVALAAGFAVSSIGFPGLGEAGRITLGIFTVAAILWIVEPFPLYVTSFVIVILEVILLGRPDGPLAMDGRDYRIFLNPFFDSVVVLLLGGFVMAQAVKRYGLDERITRRILRRVGSRPRILLLAIMATSAFLSMWISNTATTALMIAVAIPIIRSFPPGEPFRKAIILGIPFACNIGGIGTPIGTPPNAIALGILGSLGRGITFIEWMFRGVPVVVVLIIACWLLLCRLFPPGIEKVPLELGKETRMDRQSKFILVVFASVVGLWLTSKWHGVPSLIVSLIPLVAFFGLRLLEDEDLRELGWGILFVVGGGMSLGVAMRESGLSAWIVNQIPFTGLGLLVILFIFAGAAAAMTTFISNSATANLLIPIVVGVSAVAPETSAVVVALASSSAMILPISTPPNAIAYGSGYIEKKDMMRAGTVVTVISVVFISLFIYLLF